MSSDAPLDDSEAAKPQEPPDNGEDWGTTSGAAGDVFKGEPVYFRDRWFWRSVVGGLIAALLIALVGALVLAALDKAIPSAVVAIGSAAVGALGGVISGQRR